MALPGRNAFEPADPDDPTLSVDGLADLLPQHGDRYDSTLSVNTLDELFVPRLVAPITRAADEPRPIDSADDASEATGRSNDIGRGADAPRLAARNDSTPAIDRPQEIFAPELAVPIAFVDEPRTPTVKLRQEIFAPELAAPIRGVVDEPRLIVTNTAWDTTGRDADMRGGAGAATVVARVIQDIASGPRVQEMFAPELCAPIRRVLEEPRLVVEEPRVVVEESRVVVEESRVVVEEPRVVVQEPRLLVSEAERVSEAGREATIGPESVDPETDNPPLAASVMQEDLITDLGRVECEDPTLAVDSLEEFFAPEPVAPITHIVERPLLPGLESCLGEIAEPAAAVQCGTEESAKSGPDGAVDAEDGESSAEIRRAAMEFQRFAELFHAFATDIQQR